MYAPSARADGEHNASGGGYIARRYIFMRSGSVFQDADNFRFGKHFAILQRKHRRIASERMAHFLLDLGARLKLVGLADRSGYTCPLSQYLLADALGLSAVHVNRVLREEGLLTFQKGKVLFQNYGALVEFSGFDHSYLDHEGPLLR